MCAGVVIREACGGADIDSARRLFEAYAASLDVDLCFQNFAQELAGLPGDYAAPSGCLLVAQPGTSPVGCVALRPLALVAGLPRIAEIKRLFVAPNAQGAGIGRALAGSIVARARALGYDELKLDTLATMTRAQALYASLGFRECAAYYHNPLPGVAYLSLDLRARQTS